MTYEFQQCINCGQKKFGSLYGHLFSKMSIFLSWKFFPTSYELAMKLHQSNLPYTREKLLLLTYIKKIFRLLATKNFIFITYLLCFFKGNAQFVLKMTFRTLMDFKQNHYECWKYYKSCCFLKFSSPKL